MLSKKQKKEEGLVGIHTLVNPETGEKYEIDFDDTPVFTVDEYKKYNIGQPGMKSYSEMTEDERKIFIENDE